MITLDLRTQTLTVEELLEAARLETVRVVAKGGQEYIIEAVDDFDQEVAALGNSEKFMQFLEERRKAPSRIPLEEVMKRLKLLDGE